MQLLRKVDHLVLNLATVPNLQGLVDLVQSVAMDARAQCVLVSNPIGLSAEPSYAITFGMGIVCSW